MREIEVPMPKLSMTMEEGELVAWVKNEGDQVRAGEVICEVNSDKVEMEVESPADGTLVRYAAAAGDVVPVGAPIATLATEAEDLLGGLLGPADDNGAAAPAAQAPAGPAPRAAAPGRTGPGLRPVVPAARRRAAELGSTWPPSPARAATGWSGSVTSRRPPPRPRPWRPPRRWPKGTWRDPAVGHAADGGPAAGRVDAVHAHFYLTITVDAEALLGFRAELNGQLQAGVEDLKVSVNDLIVKACAGLLRTNPDLNVSWGGDKLLRHRRVHVGIAVALEGGLIVPVVRDADTKSLTQVAREARDLIGRARAGGWPPTSSAAGPSPCRTWGCSGSTSSPP